MTDYLEPISLRLLVHTAFCFKWGCPTTGFDASSLALLLYCERLDIHQSRYSAMVDHPLDGMKVHVLMGVLLVA
jgi:hypothetical protein